MIPYRVIALSVILCLPFFAVAATPIPERSTQLRARPESGMTPVPLRERAELRTREEGQRTSSRAVLRQEEHASRLARVLGLVRGMKNKMENLAQRLDTQLQAVDRRLAALSDTGHTLTIDTEYDTLQVAIATAKQEISAIISVLDTISESENPRATMQEIRPMLSQFRTTLKSVQAAFQALGVAVRSDVNTSRE